MTEAGNGGSRSRRLAIALAVIAVTGLALAVPTFRFVLAIALVLAGPVAIYGGLVAFLRGTLGMHSASRLVAGLCCGTITPVALMLALIVGSGPLALALGAVGVGCSLLAVFFAVAAFSRDRTPGGRYVPPAGD